MTAISAFVGRHGATQSSVDGATRRHPALQNRDRQTAKVPFSISCRHLLEALPWLAGLFIGNGPSLSALSVRSFHPQRPCRPPRQGFFRVPYELLFLRKANADRHADLSALRSASEDACRHETRTMVDDRSRRSGNRYPVRLASYAFLRTVVERPAR